MVVCISLTISYNKEQTIKNENNSQRFLDTIKSQYWLWFLVINVDTDLIFLSPPRLFQTAADVVPNYTWELTTTAFRVGPGGQLEVAESNLDRDPPNPGLYTFQVCSHLMFDV